MISIVTVLLGLFIKKNCGLTDFYSFFLLPVLIGVFLVLIKLFRVSDIIKDVRTVLITIRK
jgi:hypothetical protein